MNTWPPGWPSSNYTNTRASDGLALDAGLGYTTAHAIYHNHTARVDLATLDALAGALGCEPGELIAKAKRVKS